MSEREARNNGASSDWASSNQLHTLALITLTALGIYGCFRMAVPFLAPIAGALALAVIFTPLQRRLEQRLRKPGICAGIVVLLASSIVLVPAAFVTQQLAAQAIEGAGVIEQKLASGEWQKKLDAQPQLRQLVAMIDTRLNLAGAARAIKAWLTSTAGSAVQGSLMQVVGFVLMLYLLFFFLRDRAFVLRGITSLAPLSTVEMKALYERVDDTIYATVYGTLVVSLVQGCLGGLMFWWLGLPSPLLWGMVMALLAIVPVLGAFVVWAPAALFLALDGQPGAAIILTLWGVLVVGTIDNLMLSTLMGKRLKMHSVLVLFSVVGGLIVFGLSGIIVGPILLTLTLALMETWSARARASLAGN